MDTPWIVGVGTTPLGRSPGHQSALAAAAAAKPLAGAKVSHREIEGILFTNALQGAHVVHCLDATGSTTST